MDSEDHEPTKLVKQKVTFNSIFARKSCGPIQDYGRFLSEDSDTECDSKEEEKQREMTREPQSPAKLYKSLKDEVVALKAENVQLKKNVEEAEEQARMVISPLKGIGRASDLAANKIVELSKKVRELNAELASAKNKARHAEQKLLSFEQKEAQERELKSAKTAEDGSGDKANEVKELSEKLAAVNTKLCESRNQIQHLKHEIKVAYKSLASELGDSVPLQTALAPGWRGRAQQILALQAKVQELTDKLNQVNVAPLDRANLNAQIAARQIEKERQVEHQKEVAALKEELDEFKRKCEASKARIRVISSELTSMKTKMSTMTEKSNHDDQLISALTGQLAAATEKSKDREQFLNAKYEDKISLLKQELSQEKIKTNELQNIIADRDKKILRLEDKLSNTQNSIRNEAMANDYRPFSRGSSIDRTSVYSSQDILCQSSEAERMRLMELLTVTNRRLEDERAELDRIQDLLRVERHKCAKLETKLARLELDKAGCNRGTGYRKPRPKSHSEVEWDALKDRAELLEEKCLALETRLECLKQEKEEDSKRYLSLVEEARHSYFKLRKSSTT